MVLARMPAIVEEINRIPFSRLSLVVQRDFLRRGTIAAASRGGPGVGLINWRRAIRVIYRRSKREHGRGKQDGAT